MSSSFERIVDYLQDCIVSDGVNSVKGSGLRSIYARLFSAKTTKPKNEMVEDLAAFYADERSVLALWESLKPMDKELVAASVQFNGRSHRPTFRDIAQKHGFSPSPPKRFPYLEEDFAPLDFLNIIAEADPASKAILLFPGGKEFPPFILSILKGVVPPFVFEYGEFKPSDKNVVISRQDRLSDFAEIVKFCAAEKVKVNLDNHFVAKAKLVKAREVIGFDDVGDDGSGGFCDIRDVAGGFRTVVAQPLFAIMLNCGLLDADPEDRLVKPGKSSMDLLSLPLEEQAKLACQYYLMDLGICESRYLAGVGVPDGERLVWWTEARRKVANLLKTCPVDRFVPFEDFEKYMRIFNGDFISRLLDAPIVLRYNDGFRNYFRPASWDYCHVHFLRVILSFFSAVGAVDVAYKEKVNYLTNAGNFDSDGVSMCLGVGGLRLTELGAWIFGLTESFLAPPTEGEEILDSLVVNDDFSVIVGYGQKRIQREIFLRKFFTPLPAEVGSVAFKIDLPGVTRAYAQGVPPKKIVEYLEEEGGRPLPEAVADAFAVWKEKTGRITLRSVTLLETDDKELLDMFCGMEALRKYLGAPIKNAAVVREDKKKSVKAVLEKNGWHVRDDD
ncbi:MAG: hypothetical protein LBJ64_05310 [Deltaproteobacteria bacterium]|jgi:hypothetical protein|nr:hypothetical protein [Deltaproteobacteria bacterium]